MNVGPMSGLVGSAAGAPLSQTSGSESERAQRDSSAQQRQIDSELKGEKASGIGQTEEDQSTSERDADGRRLWEGPQDKNQQEPGDSSAPVVRQSKDPTGNSGNAIDLTG